MKHFLAITKPYDSTKHDHNMSQFDHLNIALLRILRITGYLMKAWLSIGHEAMSLYTQNILHKEQRNNIKNDYSQNPR